MLRAIDASGDRRCWGQGGAAWAGARTVSGSACLALLILVATSISDAPAFGVTPAGTVVANIAAAHYDGGRALSNQAEFVVIFSDVPGTHWAFDEVMACVGTDVLCGYPDGSYRPELPVDRAQMAIYISRALAGGEAHVPAGPATATFLDVPVTDIAYRHVEYAVANEIVFGYPGDNLYHPDSEADRGQMAVFVARAIATPAGESGMATYAPAVTTFADVTSDPLDPYQACHRYVEYIAEQGVTQGYPDGLYHPEYIVSRGLMAIYLARAFRLQT